MNNTERRNIIEKAKMAGYQGSYVDLFRQAELNPGSDPRDMFAAITPEEQEQGLRPMHAAGRTDASMTFPNVPPHTPFNTIGMAAPIDIKKYDTQGHLVKSYENVPPGLTNLDTGPNTGTVLETPSRMQEGGPVKEETGNPSKFGISKNLLERLGTYGKTRQEAEQDPYYEGRYDISRDDAFDFLIRSFRDSMNDQQKADMLNQMANVKELEEGEPVYKSVEGRGHYDSLRNRVYIPEPKKSSTIYRGSLESEEYIHGIQQIMNPDNFSDYGITEENMQDWLPGGKEDLPNRYMPFMSSKKGDRLTALSKEVQKLVDLNPDGISDDVYYGGTRNVKETEAMLYSGIMHGRKMGILPEDRKITKADFPNIISRIETLQGKGKTEEYDRSIQMIPDHLSRLSRVLQNTSNMSEGSEDILLKILNQDLTINTQQMQTGGFNETPADLRYTEDDKKLSSVIDWVMNNPFSQALKEATRPIWGETFYENFRPVPYPTVSAFQESAEEAMKGNSAPPRKDSKGRPAFEEEAYRMALALPVKNIYFEQSPYKPGVSEDPNASYYRVHPQVLDRKYFASTYGNEPVGFKAVVQGVPFREGFGELEDFESDPLANYTVSVGEDEKGKYVSIYDKYDLKGAGNHLIKPFEIYDRIYVDSPREIGSVDYTRRPSAPRQNAESSRDRKLLGGDKDSPKKNKPNKPNQGVINTQNTLRFRTKTNLPANGVWSDEWEKVYTDYLDSQRNTMFSETNTRMPHLFPSGLKSLFGDILYNQTGINTGRNWSAKEKAAMDEIAKQNLEKGKYVIEYGDYQTGTRYGDVGGGEFVGDTFKKLYNPAYNLKTTFGQAQIGLAPEWGDREEDTIIFDQYDFNDGRDENILDPRAWGRVASDFVHGGIYGGLRSMGRQFGTPDGEGRDVTMVTNRKKGGPRRRAQYGDFVTGRETYEPYQAASDNTATFMPPPPTFELNPITPQQREEINKLNEEEYNEWYNSLPMDHYLKLGPQGIKPMAFGPVEAALLGGAALATGALSSTVGAAARGGAALANFPLLGSNPAVSSVTLGNLTTAGFGVHGATELSGMGTGPGLKEVITGTGRARNYTGLDKAGYAGIRALELAPFGRNAVNLAEFGATQAGFGLGADVAYSGLGLQSARTKLAKTANDIRIAAMESRFVQSDFYNALRPSYMGRPDLRARLRYYIPGYNPDGPGKIERFGAARARSLASVRAQNAEDVVASSRLFPTARQLVYTEQAPLYEEVVQEMGATQRAFKGYYSDPQNIDKFMRGYRDHVMGLSRFGGGYGDDVRAMSLEHTDPMKSLLGEVEYQLQGIGNTRLAGSAFSRWLSEPASFKYNPQSLSIYPKRLPGVGRGSNQDLAEKLMADARAISQSPLSGDPGAVQRGLLDLTRSRMGFQAANANPMTIMTPREAFYGLGLQGQQFSGVSFPYMMPSNTTDPVKHLVTGFRYRLGLTDALNRFSEPKRMASVGSHENWHSLFNTRPRGGGIGINHLRPELESLVGSRLPGMYSNQDPTIYLRTIDEIGANLAQSRIPLVRQGFPESSIYTKNLMDNPYQLVERDTAGKLVAPYYKVGTERYSTPWSLEPKFKTAAAIDAEGKRRIDELMKVVPGIGGIGVGLHLQLGSKNSQ